MIPVYLISDDGAPERLVALWADAERLGIQLTRVSTGSSNDPAVAYMDGHRRAWQRVADSEAPFAMVIEDSVALDERVVPLLDRDFLSRALLPRAVVLLDTPDVKEAERLDTAIIEPNAVPRSTRAYIVTRIAVRKLLAFESEAGPVAHVLARRKEHGISTLVVVPPPVIDNSDDTSGGLDEATGVGGAVGRAAQRVRKMFANSAAGFQPIAVPAPRALPVGEVETSQS